MKKKTILRSTRPLTYADVVSAVLEANELTREKRLLEERAELNTCIQAGLRELNKRKADEEKQTGAAPL